MSKPTVDSVDRRCENTTDSPNRQYRALLKSKGLCTRCGKTPVKNRSVCCSCTRIINKHSQLTGFRKHLEGYGVDLEALIFLLESYSYNPELTDLTIACIAAKKQRISRKVKTCSHS